MRAKVMFLLIAVTITTLVATGLTKSNKLDRSSATSPATVQGRPKTLKQIAMDRDVEVDGVDGSQHLSHVTIESVTQNASAIVYGRISDSRSFFEERASEIEQGETITTEYTVEVLKVLRNRTEATPLPPDKPQPTPLTTPLKIARNGGAVFVNGHRASVKVKGYEALNSGDDYVFFLYWSSDYEAYVLPLGIFSVLRVNHDLSLKPLGLSKEIETEARSLTLEGLIHRLK